MALQFISDAGSIIIPGAYPSIRVQPANAGLATQGVVMLMGEADAGPDFGLETDISQNLFGPGQLATVQSKYKSGNLVDAFSAVVAASNDPNIAGSPSAVVLVKTNKSDKAFSLLKKTDASNYATLADKSFGKLGNLIFYKVTEDKAESVPTTGDFTWINNVDTVAVSVRVNGGASQTFTLAINNSPSGFVTTFNGAVTGVTASGGANRSIITSIAGKTLAVGSISGNSATITLAGGTWATTPSVGDTMIIPAGSVIVGTGNANVGAWVISSATTTTIVATKLSDANKPGAVPGTITAPLAVSAIAVAAITDVQAFAPVKVQVNAANPIDGAGKALEISELTTGVDLLSRYAYQLNTTVVTWVSKSSGAKLLTSSQEKVVALAVNRQLDGVQESFKIGGEIALQIGYKGTTGTLTVSVTHSVNASGQDIVSGTLTTTVTGGSGSSLSLNLKDFPTVADLVEFISTKTGYSAVSGTASLGQISSLALDSVSAVGIATEFGEKSGRVKIDGFRFGQKVNEGSALVQTYAGSSVPTTAPQVNISTPPAVGLPDVNTTNVFLSGGVKGGTTNANVSSALTELEKVRGNYLVPLFSRDAASDITDGLTESSSTYTIDSINAAVKTHVLALSTVKRRRNRQGFLSFRGTFAAAKTAAANIASFRSSMTFQDVRVVGSGGSIQQFHPWMGSVLAAGMQAAGFFRAIVHKFVNINGVLQAAADFNDQDDVAMEEALLAGLLPLRRSETGGFFWVSDQSTYSKDTNFVFNSIQMVSSADIVALTTAKRMEDAFVGQSIAEVSASQALSFLEGVMDDFLRLKLLAPSDDAPLGFKNAVITISGPAMRVSVEIKLAGAIYFIPISFLVTQVTQTATSGTP